MFPERLCLEEEEIMKHGGMDIKCFHNIDHVLQNANFWQIWEPLVFEGIANLPKLSFLFSSRN